MNLVDKRKLSGLKQGKIAEDLGICRQQYANIENGKSRIKPAKLTLLASIFKCSELEIVKAWKEKGNESYDRKRTQMVKNA